MKIIGLILALLFSVSLSFGQSLSVFDLDTTNFPTIKAKFYAFDKDGKQITNLSTSDFEVKENGRPRTVTYVSCPPSKPAVALSSVLVMDASGSMSDGPPRIQSAKNAANAWIDGLPLGLSECALVDFDDKSNIVQDFTTSRDKLKVAIDKLIPRGGTNYNQALIDLPAGGLQIAKSGKYKRVIIFLTDGLPNSEPNTTEIIKFANDNDITIYAVTLEMPTPQSIKDMTSQTGGQYFENITTQKEAEETYRKLLQSAQGGDPCEIEWQSEFTCLTGTMNVEIGITNLGISANTNYTISNSLVAKLEFNPSSVKFYSPEIGVKVEEKVTVTARNANFNITNITCNNESFEITPNSFTLNSGESKELTISYIVADSSYVYAGFDIENDVCKTKYYASVVWKGKKPTISTIKLIHPNGGEIFVAGSDTIITWEGIPPDELVKLEYSTNNGINWTTIADYVSGLQYIWKNLPKPPSTLCKVRIKHVSTLIGTKKPGNLIHTLTGFIYDVNWSPDGSRVATASWSIASRIWDSETGEVLHSIFGLTGTTNTIRWSPDGSHLATTGGVYNAAYISDSGTGITLDTLFGHTGYVVDVNWSPDGNYVATASNDSTARIWDIGSGETLHTLIGHTDKVFSVKWCPDGSRIATVSDDKTVRIWDVKTGDILHTLSGTIKHVFEVNWSPDGTRVATANWENTAAIWDAESGVKLHTLNGHTDNVLGVRWSPDGSRIATSSEDRTIKIWDAENGSTLHTLGWHASTILDVNWSPDGSLIASSSKDQTARIWDSETGEALHMLSGHDNRVNIVRWSPDGSRVVTASRNAAKIWAVGGFEVLQEDESDNVFSIVAPSVSANDIDMLQCLVGTNMDSVVVDFVKNTGSWKFRVDSIYFQGADADAFSLVSGLPKYVVDANQVRHAEFRFIPNRVGIHSAEIVIITQAETLTQSIRGEGVSPSLEVVSDFIDFGLVDIPNYKDTLQVATIKNIGKSPIQITNTKHNFPNEFDFTTLSGGGNFILQSGEEAKMDLRFTPSDVGRTSGTLEFHYVGFGSPAVIQLFGEGVNRKPIIQTNINDFQVLICEQSTKNEINVENTGGNPLVISELNINGLDQNDFKINTALPITIDPKENSIIEIEFRPQTAGNKSAELEIKSNADPDSLLIIYLNANKESTDYTLNKTELDFGYIRLNELSELEFEIKNSGTIKNSYNLSTPAKITIPEIDFALNPNETKIIKATYLRSSTSEEISGLISINENTCNKSRTINLSGKVFTAYASIKTIEISAYAGDQIELPIILNDKESLDISGVTSLSAELIFNPTLLYPIGYNVIKINEKEAKIKIENINPNVNANQVLTTIQFIAALGNAESCKLTLSNAESVGGEAEIQVIDGTFKLLGICYEGGARLINPNNKVELLQISPNPNDGNLAVELNLIEEGFSTLSIYNSNGQLMYEQNITGTTGKIDLNIDTKEYGNGLYFVSLQTPTIRKVKQMVVFK
ncbi:MAG: choice-of-anchor D domain-containing protein [Candidatus Kapabacteria bacterium]|nr:choice-of-anchor D domain-containing protein [Candidatus Kapabacteria bacterium]